MKRLSKILAAVLCAAVVVGTLLVPTKAQAEESTTFLVHYQDGWWVQVKDGSWVSLNSINSHLKDGDKILIEETSYTPGTQAIIKTDKKISEFAVKGNVVGVLHANVDHAYAVSGGTLIVNGRAEKVSAFPGTVNQINGDAGYVEASYADDVATRFAVTGKVDHFKGRISNGTVSPEEVYDIPAGKCVSTGDASFVWLEGATLKTTPSATTQAVATAPAANSKKELDDVPKTGLTTSGTVICLSIAAAFAFCAVLVSGKKTEEA